LKAAAHSCISPLRCCQVWTTDVCVPISRLADIIQTTKDDIDKSGLLGPIVGHVGDGNFHVLLSVNPKDDEQMKVAKGVNQRMVQRAIEMVLMTLPSRPVHAPAPPLQPSISPPSLSFLPYRRARALESTAWEWASATTSTTSWV
jgi:hypothetical protein